MNVDESDEMNHASVRVGEDEDCSLQGAFSLTGRRRKRARAPETGLYFGQKKRLRASQHPKLMRP